MRTQVGIVGGGPAGLTLALLLERQGIECVVLESRSREYVERRVRAGLLEHNTVSLLHELGAGDRRGREGLRHGGIYLRRQGRTTHIPITKLTGRHITIYGQQEVVKDEIAAWCERGGALHFEVPDVAVGDLESDRPVIEFTLEGSHERLECDFIAGCDGFHGICRAALPDGLAVHYDHEYPFRWLGILAGAAPATEELIYAWHERGFALYTMRSSSISRLYIQVPAGERLEKWSDAPLGQERPIGV